MPVRKFWIPGGDLGTIATLHAMRQQAMIAAALPAIQRRARAIVGPSTDPATWAMNLRAWLASHTRFTPDPIALELVRTPLAQLQAIDAQGFASGDCDDVATLGAALARALGMRARFVVLGFGSPSAPFQHVYTNVWTATGWRDFDVTRTARSAKATRCATMEIP